MVLAAVWVCDASLAVFPHPQATRATSKQIEHTSRINEEARLHWQADSRARAPSGCRSNHRARAHGAESSDASRRLRLSPAATTRSRFHTLGAWLTYAANSPVSSLITATANRSPSWVVTTHSYPCIDSTQRASTVSAEGFACLNAPSATCSARVWLSNDTPMAWGERVTIAAKIPATPKSMATTIALRIQHTARV